jgi:HK97 family phage prohead protease
MSGATCLQSVARAREAAALIEAGAIDGLSIGFRTVRATKNDKGQRLLSELELWEVSLVTFPMLPQARLSQVRPEEAKAEMLRELATVFDDARRKMAVRSAR